jgi:ribonuclease HII
VKRDKPIDRFAFERELFKVGLQYIAGVDEAGRGPLAGPVVAAAAMLPVEWIEGGLPKPLFGLNDSKQLTAIRRETFFEVLTTSPNVHFAVTAIDSGQVDALNILRATHEAMKSALGRLRPRPEHVLIDGMRVTAIRFPQTPLIEGDGRSYSIAAASVIAKVTRDRLMTRFDREWPGYGFADHKGYATPQHVAALMQHGPCPIHRRSFAPLRPAQLQLFG